MLIDFEVFVVEDPETTRTEISALNATQAAEQYVATKEARMSDYPVGWGKDSIEVGVKTLGGNVYLFRVTGQPEPVYNAEPID